MPVIEKIPAASLLWVDKILKKEKEAREAHACLLMTRPPTSHLPPLAPARGIPSSIRPHL